MKLESGKNSKRDRMMRLKCFETQEMKEIDRKKAGWSKGFSILWVGIIENIFQMKGKESKDHKRLKLYKKKSVPE